MFQMGGDSEELLVGIADVMCITRHEHKVALLEGSLVELLTLIVPVKFELNELRISTNFIILVSVISIVRLAR